MMHFYGVSMIKARIVVLAVVWFATLSAQAAPVDLATQAREGGLPLLGILGLSLLATTVAIERLRNLRAAKVIPAGLTRQVDTLWDTHDYAGIDTLLEQQDSSLARVLAYLVSHRHQDFAIVSVRAEELVSVELRRHQQKFYALSIAATAAPICGLLGTVVGMIASFNTIAYEDGMGNPALLAGGISMALVNTAAGLCVALPALLLHHFFRNRIVQLGLALETEISDLIDRRFLPATDCSPALPEVAHAR
jgi:biopolymer transport protein ExbB